MNLVLSGGGQRCLAFVGFLRAARPSVRSVRNVCCVSGGAIAGLAFCLGVDDDTVVRLVSRHVSGGVKANLALLLTGFGLDDARERLAPMLRAVIAEHFATEALKRGESKPPPLGTAGGASGMTFADLLKATGRNLVVHASSVIDGRVKIMSADATPSASVVDAICASCAVPLFFCPVRMDGDLLVDGCLSESYPFLSIIESAPAPTSPGLAAVAQDTLVLSAEFDQGGPEDVNTAPRSLMEYAMRLIGMVGSRWNRKDAAAALGARAKVFRVNAACDVTAVRVMCEGLDAAAVTRLYRVGLDEGHRFVREQAAADEGCGV